MNINNSAKVPLKTCRISKGGVHETGQGLPEFNGHFIRSLSNELMADEWLHEEGQGKHAFARGMMARKESRKRNPASHFR